MRQNRKTESNEVDIKQAEEQGDTNMNEFNDRIHCEAATRSKVNMELIAGTDRTTW